MALNIYVESKKIFISTTSIFASDVMFIKLFLSKLEAENLQLYNNLINGTNFIIREHNLDSFEYYLKESIEELYTRYLQEINTKNLKRQVAPLYLWYFSYFEKEILCNIKLFETDMQLYGHDKLWEVVLEARKLNMPITLEYVY